MLNIREEMKGMSNKITQHHLRLPEYFHTGIFAQIEKIGDSWKWHVLLYEYPSGEANSLEEAKLAAEDAAFRLYQEARLFYIKNKEAELQRERADISVRPKWEWRKVAWEPPFERR